MNVHRQRGMEARPPRKKTACQIERNTVQMSAEQFGTNLRATAAISIPNLVRGFLPLMLILFQFLRSSNVLNNYVTAAWVTGIIVIVIGFVSALYTKETFGKDLDFVEK